MITINIPLKTGSNTKFRLPLIEVNNGLIGARNVTALLDALFRYDGLINAIELQEATTCSVIVAELNVSIGDSIILLERLLAAIGGELISVRNENGLGHVVTLEGIGFFNKSKFRTI